MSEPALLALVALPLVGLLVYMVVEVVRRRDLTVGRKLLWVGLLLVLPVVVLAIYIVARPPREVQISGGRADRAKAETIVLLAERRQRGELTDDEYHAEVATVASVD